MRGLPIVAALVMPLLGLTSPAQGAEQVGSAAAVKNDIRGTLAGQMHTGSAVHQNETVSSGADSSAQLLFRDRSSLTLGPSSQVKIDSFVYDPNRGTGGAALNLAKGALRFVSGSKSSGENTSVKTPLATMGVRGTVAELYVSDFGYEFFLLIEGQIDVCVPAGCQTITTPGEYIVVAPDGTLSPPAPWPGPMLDLTASVAFLETYFSHIVRGDDDVLPRFRTLNEAIRTQEFTAPDFSTGCYYCEGDE